MEVCAPLSEGYSKHETAEQLGLRPQELAWRIAALKWEIETGEAVVTLLTAAAELGISGGVAFGLARKLDLRTFGFPKMILAADFERLAASVDSRRLLRASLRASARQ